MIRCQVEEALDGDRVEFFDRVNDRFLDVAIGKQLDHSTGCVFLSGSVQSVRRTSA